MAESKKIPDIYKNLDKWETDRRAFLKAALIAGAASQITWFTSCSAELEKGNEFLSSEQSTILKSILGILWPDDGNGPSIEDLNTFGYFIWLLSNELSSDEDKDFIIEGLDWCDEKSVEIYNDHYYELSDETKEVLVAQLIELDYGTTWMNIMIDYILESLILDPIYGGNKDESGWKWLDHESGLPRPTEMTRVESIYQKYLPNA